jgi:hypothetical protein
MAALAASHCLPDHWRYIYTEDQLTQLFIADVMVGIDGCP